MMRTRANPCRQSGLLAATVLGSALSGCAYWPDGGDAGRGPEVPVTTARMPSSVQPYTRIEKTLACIRQTGVLSGRTFVVGPFADSTGKINAVAAGSTGNFMPQGGSAAYLTDALTKAGGRVVSTYFGAPTQAVPAHYAINGIFNSLDFGTLASADARVVGLGPIVNLGWAQLSLTIQLDEVATRVNRQMSMIQRPVRYAQAGVGIGHDFNGYLATGQVTFQNQERLQLESLNGPIALGVADVVMKEFPVAHERCSGLVSELLAIGPDESETPPSGRPMKIGAVQGNVSKPESAATEQNKPESWTGVTSASVPVGEKPRVYGISMRPSAAASD